MSPDLHHLSGAYAVDALDEAERASFEQHLEGCADCRAEVAELSDTAHHLSALSEATPPAALRASVLQGISRVRPLPPLADPASVTSTSAVPEGTRGPTAPVPPAERSEDGAGSGATVIPLRRRASTWFAAAAAAVAIAAGGVAWGPWSDPGSPVDQVVSASDATRVTQTKGSLTAELAVSRELGKGAITVTGMPQAPEGKTYQLWYVGADGVARSAGLMDPGAGGEGSLVLEGSPNDAAAVGVTLEPAGGSTAPTTEPIVVLALA